MRVLGKGISQLYGVIGAVFSLAGIVAGKLATVVWFVAEQEAVTVTEVLSALSPADYVTILEAGFAPMDVLFYGLALYCGYKYAFRQISEADVDQLVKQG